MSAFELYLKLGFWHITDWAGYDHMLFLLALCGAYSFAEWRKVALLVTAFTLGHSLTLALTALDVIRVNANLIEFLIPLTIFLTALGTIFYSKSTTKRYWMLSYVLALAFGLIHGMGFSNYFRSLLGNANDVIAPLLYFNIGVEIGQLAIVTAILLIGWVMRGPMRVPPNWWRIGISVMAGGIAIWLMVERL